MTLFMGQVAVPGNATVAAFIVPAGLSNGFAYQPSSSVQPVYIGNSPSVSSTNGQQISGSPVSPDSYNSTRSQVIYATTGNATASTFYFLVSTAE